MQLIFIKLLLCILLIAQGALSINIPSGDALNFDGVTHVVLPEFAFGGAFTIEVWAQANFTGRAGPLVFFGNEVDQEQEQQQQEGVAPVAVPAHYLQLAVSDVVAFRKRVPSSEAELSYIRPHLTTNLDTEPLIRRVQASIPAEFSGRWVLIHVRADSDGVLSIYVNKALVLQTSALDIPVLPMILPRGTNFIGASPSESFLGQIQSVTLWSRALAPQDITVNTLKVYDGGLIGRWDFSKIDGVVVLNQAADDKYAVKQKTAVLEARLEGLQQQITAAELTLASARASGSYVEIEAAETAVAEARQALAQARYVSNPGYSGVSVALVAPDDNGEQLDNIMAVANSPDAWEDPTSVSTQIAQLTGVTRQRTANTLSDLAFIASKDVSETDTYLKASLDSMNKLPFKATNVNARPAIKTNLISRPSSVSNYGSVAERLDGTIVHSETGQKRWDWLGWLIRFIYKLITRCRPEDLDMRCTWSNDPHYTLKPVRGNWQSRYDYHSPSCHYILKVGDEVLIQEQSYRCGNAGCISQVGAFISGRFLVIFYSNGKVTLNGKDVAVPYKIADDVMLIKKDNKVTLVVDGIFELFFSGSAGLLFTQEQLDKADTRSICAQKGYTGQVLPGFSYDLAPSECFLDPTWQPPATQCPKCVNGRAVFDLTRGCDCECDAGWRGDLCDEYYCEKCVSPAGTCQGPNTCRCNTTDPFYVFGCSGCDCKCQRDYCYNGGSVSITTTGGCACSCPDGFSGDRCQNPRCPVGDNGFLCNGQGTCLPDGTCQCIKDVSFGDACEGNCGALVCPSDSGRTCSNHGSCVCGKCVCDTGFLGESCSIPDCTNVTSTPDSNGCGKHGECVGTGNVPSCDCNDGWSGDRCTEFTCSPSCSQYGNCTAADPPYCRCRVGFTSTDCSLITCNFLSDCNAPKGACTLPTGADLPNCKCKEHWAGSECGKPLCPNECSHQGECIDSPVGSDSPPTCKCQAPWIGDDCSVLPDCEVDKEAGDWSSPEWEARAIEICSNTSYISSDHYNNCLFDARQIDNFEVLYSLAYQSYLECQHNETEGGPLCGKLCPNFCTFNGICSPDGECQCNPGFYGADCSIQPNSRGFLIQYDGRAQESVINQVVQAASPLTYLQIGATGATQTSNEIANAAVVFLYQDYRPKYSDCKPYNDLYLAILVDQAKSLCSQSANAKFNFAVSFDVPSIAVAQAHHCKPTKTASGYSFECSWKYGQNAAVVVGPLAQNLSWAIDVSLDDTKGSCIDSVYYGSEAMTGTTDLVPIPIAQASEIRIVSELLNSHCGTITSCSTCMDTYGCGWCPDLGYCMDGTASGPLYGSCSVWRFDTNPAESRVVATSGYSNPVFPSNLDVYLVDGSHVDAYAYVVFPSDKMSVESMFLVDLSEEMAGVVAAFGAQASSVFSGIIKAYPDSTAALSGFTDKPISPYGSASERDYVYQEYSFKTKNASTFGAAATALKIGNGGDSANAQLEALLHVALRPSSGFTGSHRVVIVITGTPYHVPPVVGKPNNLDVVINADEDYPFVTDVRAALIDANVVPLFLVFGGDALVANYTKLVQQIGFGVVRRTTEASIADQVMSGMEEIFSTATLVASSPKFIRDVFPSSYKTILGNSRVKFTVRLDRSALKRSELFDTQATLLAPGFGSVNLRLAKSDIPVGTDISVTMKQNTKKTITLNGANIYNTALAFRIVSLPGNGTLWQYNEAGIQEQITSVPTEVKDGLHRVVYVPAPGGSCQHQASDYCSRRRFCYNPCPYATFQYELVDACAASSIRVNVSVDVIADLVNNRPIAFLASAPFTPQDVNLPIFLNGYDKDNDTLSSIITTLPAQGGKLIYKGVTLTASMLPFTVTNRTIVYSPPYRRWGDKFESFTYYVNDGKKSFQMGDSAPYVVEIDVLLTNHRPEVRNVAAQANEGTELSTKLLVTDEDAIDFERGEVHVFVLDAPTPEQGVLYQANGAVIKAGDEVLDTKTWVVRFKPAIYGNYSFRYRAFDTQQYSTIANMTFIVNFVNQRPTASDAYYTTLQGTPLHVTFPGFDREGDPITWFVIKPAVDEALLYDEAKNNVTITTTAQYSLQSGFVLFAPTTRTGALVRVPFSVGTTRPFGETYTMFVDVINVNDPPEFTVPQEITVTANQNARSAANPLSSITFNDVDNPSANFFISIKLTGPGSLELPVTTGLTNLTVTTTLITFNGRLKAVSDSLKTLTYSMTTGSSVQTYTATILLEAYDYDPTDPKWGRATVVVKTSTTAAAPSNMAATVGAVGAGAAAAIGLAAMYQFVKAKKLLPEESNPFAAMGDEGAVDVVLENPLYRRPNPL